MGNALGKGLALVAGIAIARFLGSTQYGQYGVIKGTLLSIAIFSSFGLGYTATKFIAECRFSNRQKVADIHRINTWITLISSGIIAIIIAIFAAPLAAWLDDPSLAPIFRWSSIAIVFNAFITTQNGELGGFKEYRIIARNTVITGLLTFVCVVPSAYYGGLLWAVIALVFTLFCNCLINLLSIRRLIAGCRKIRIERVLVREIVKFSLPVALQESLYSITSWTGMAILIKMSSYGQLGLYSAASQWQAVMLFIPGALRNVALSHISENLKNEEASTRITKRLMLVNLLSTGLPFVLILCLSSWIQQMYGESYAGLWLVLDVCACTAIVGSLTNVLTQDLIAHNKNWYLFWSRLFRDSLSLIIGYVLILNYQGYAAACFASAWFVMQTVYLILLIYKRKSISQYQAAK